MKKYCVNCNKECEIIEKRERRTYDVKGTLITEIVHVLICKECQEEVWDMSIEKENETAFFSAYRKKMNLLFPDEIKAIRNKYNLSQVSFAKMLGFGEKTIARYENGAIQDACHDNLIRLMEDASTFLKVWERNKNLLSYDENKRIKQIMDQDKLSQFSSSYSYSNPYQTNPNRSLYSFSAQKGGYKNVG